MLLVKSVNLTYQVTNFARFFNFEIGFSERHIGDVKRELA
jgi:hypothetical protein